MKKFWYDGLMGYIVFAGGAVVISGLFYWFFQVGPKLDLCRRYYSDLPTYTCFMSPLGLPLPVRNK